jgi:ABC-2 type transport system permease protein
MTTAALTKLTIVESKLFVRDFGSVFFALAFPAVLLLALGLVMPGFRDPIEELDGVRPIDLYLPVVAALAIATTALVTLPSYLATYRERKVLRRLAVTPARPVTLLVAQLAVNLVATLVAGVFAFTAGIMIFQVEAPENLAGFVLAFALGAAAMFGIGLLLAAIMPNPRVANGVGMLLYFPMLFFAGGWLPGPAMPEPIRAVGELTPLGAAAQAFHETWAGGWPSPLQIAVMLGYLLFTGALAARSFRYSYE